MQSMQVISYCSQTARDLSVAIVIFILLAISAPLLASDDQLIITPCDHCETEQDFAMAAKQVAPEPPPGDAQYRIYSVYVVNFLNIEVRFFNVAVWREEGEILSMAGTYQSGVNKVAYPGDGDPEIVDGIIDAVNYALAAKAYYSGGVSATEIDTSIGSAIALVGPDDSEHGYNRLILMNEINDHHNSLPTTLGFVLADFGMRLANRFLGNSEFVTYLGNIVIQFDDGTSIEVDVNGVRDGERIRLELEVRQDTARLPDGKPVPQSAGHFSNFSYSDSGGGPSVAQQLYWLALMYGIEVGEPGDGMDCDFSCEPDRCRLTCRP